LGRRSLNEKGKIKMTEKEKETIVDALELGIVLSEDYFQKLKFLLRNSREEGDDEKENEYFIKLKETRSKITALEKLKEQYK
jgi:hypothetical protein